MLLIVNIGWLGLPWERLDWWGVWLLIKLLLHLKLLFRWWLLDLVVCSLAILGHHWRLLSAYHFLIGLVEAVLLNRRRKLVLVDVGERLNIYLLDWLVFWRFARHLLLCGHLMSQILLLDNTWDLRHPPLVMGFDLLPFKILASELELFSLRGYHSFQLLNFILKSFILLLILNLQLQLSYLGLIGQILIL